jgi:hypothetical protein
MKKQISTTLIFILCLSGQVLFSQHLTNNGSAIIVSEGASLTVTGNVTLLSEVTFDNSGDIFVGGKWINNSPDDIYMQDNTGTVTFNGSLPQSIEGEHSTHFSKLLLEQHTDLGSETSVSTLLGLTGSRLTLNGHHFLAKSGAQITGAGADAYIVAEGAGLLVREVGEMDVEFPVGTSTSYLPATLFNSGTIDNYGINVFEGVLDGGLNGATIPEIDHCVNNTWNLLEQEPGDSDLSVTVQWNADNEGTLFNRALSGIGHYTDGAWQPQDAALASGDDPYSLTRAGITSIGAFAVGDDNSPMVVAIIYDEQDIFLSQGWTGISSYLQPLDPAVEVMLAPLINELVILQNLVGYYWPGQGINTLGNWDTHSGYQIKMSGEILLTLTGSTEANTTLNLSEGWNLIPVISNCGVKVENLFNGTSLVLIKGIANNLLYWPEFGIESLDQLMPGSAYMVLMGADEDVIFPSCDKSLVLSQEHKVNSSSLELKEAADISGNPELVPTPNTHTVAVPVSAFKEIDIAPGDIVEAFDENNHCYGLAQWKGEAMAITLFGDDQTTGPADGFSEMSQINFKIFKASTNGEISVEAVYNTNLPEHDGLFVSNGISAVRGFKLNPAGIYNNGQSEIQLYPNPAKDHVFIDLQFDAEVELSIFNLQGVELISLTIGGHSTEVSTSGLLPGTYLVKINNRNKSSLQRLIIQ